MGKLLGAAFSIMHFQQLVKSQSKRGSTKTSFHHLTIKIYHESRTTLKREEIEVKVLPNTRMLFTF
jgi:hypothetical protein